MKSEQVLVIDDDHDTRILLAEIFLCRMKCRALTACSVDEAQALLEQQTFRLIISDFEMPQRNGSELAKVLANLSCETPLLFYTGERLSNQFWGELDYPCLAVQKPNLNDLLSIAAKFLRSSD